MTCRQRCALRVERVDLEGVSDRIVAALEREAAHLIRRDGRRRLVVAWPDLPPSIEEIDYDDHCGPRVLSVIALA